MFWKRVPALLSALILFLPSLCFSEAVPEPTATPEPVQIPASPDDPPAVILRMTEIAFEEWEMGMVCRVHFLVRNDSRCTAGKPECYPEKTGRL